MTEGIGHAETQVARGRYGETLMRGRRSMIFSLCCLVQGGLAINNGIEIACRLGSGRPRLDPLGEWCETLFVA